MVALTMMWLNKSIITLNDTLQFLDIIYGHCQKQTMLINLGFQNYIKNNFNLTYYNPRPPTAKIFRIKHLKFSCKNIHFSFLVALALTALSLIVINNKLISNK